jgi:hypothetical protein
MSGPHGSAQAAVSGVCQSEWTFLESHSLEDKLIAPKAVCSSQIEEAKPKCVVQENYCLRLCDFKRIAAEPVYPIVIDRHSSFSLIVRKIPHWVTIRDNPWTILVKAKAGIKMALTAYLPNAPEQ